jgi:deoxyinosine 3'endonuclease (endonuclease V)
MAETGSLKELRAQELTTLRERVAKRMRLKPLSKRGRRMVGIDVALTHAAQKVHVCACLMSLPRLEVLEEAIATDEFDPAAYRQLGGVVVVPLMLSVLKMLKRNYDVVAVREPSRPEQIPIASFVGVISGKPCFGVIERAASVAKIAKWDGEIRAGTVKLRGHKMPVGVIAGHNLVLRDAKELARSSAKATRLPDPIYNAGTRVKAWEREWKRVNLGKRHLSRKQ